MINSIFSYGFPTVVQHEVCGVKLISLEALRLDHVSMLVALRNHRITNSEVPKREKIQLTNEKSTFSAVFRVTKMLRKKRILILQTVYRVSMAHFGIQVSQHALQCQLKCESFEKLYMC